MYKCPLRVGGEQALENWELELVVEILKALRFQVSSLEGRELNAHPQGLGLSQR